jgi:predicted dehydrogenase
MSQAASSGRREGTRFRAAIIGLGQIGNQFDDDPKRTVVWTHAGAYLAMPDVELVAGADPDEERLQRFLARRGVTAGYHDYREMLRRESLDLLSVCSPTNLHYEMVLEGVKAGVKAIFCEKPIAATVDEAVEMVEACSSAGVVLAVNHTRRWESIYVHAKRLLEQNRIGRIESIVGYYPGKVFTMGTHVFDLMRYFAGEVEWVSGVNVGQSVPEPHVSGNLRFRSGAHGSVVSGWERANHLVEIDCIGSGGRLRISGDGTHLEVFTFEDSRRYSNYRELVASPFEDTARVQDQNRLVAAVQDLVMCASTGSAPACTGEDGLAALEIACGLVESAQVGGRRVLLSHRGGHALPTEAGPSSTVHKKAPAWLPSPR